jgi:hypothetical protein
MAMNGFGGNECAYLGRGLGKPTGASPSSHSAEIRCGIGPWISHAYPVGVGRSGSNSGYGLHRLWSRRGWGPYSPGTGPQSIQAGSYGKESFHQFGNVGKPTAGFIRPTDMRKAEAIPATNLN